MGGIAFAVMLILMQLGFRASLFDSATRYQRLLNYDVAIFSRDSQFIVRPASFSNRRLYQALAVAVGRQINFRVGHRPHSGRRCRWARECEHSGARCGGSTRS
jgi:hypothetical protein